MPREPRICVPPSLPASKCPLFGEVLTSAIDPKRTLLVPGTHGIMHLLKPPDPLIQHGD